MSLLPVLPKSGCAKNHPRRARDVRHLELLVSVSARTATAAATIGALGAAAASTNGASWELRDERGVPFVTGEAFYRAESCAGRDLAVLAAALQRQRTGQLRVLDVMAGSGMRGARYLMQADADEVWINDGSTDLHDAMVYNMCTAAGLPTVGMAGSPEAVSSGPNAAGSGLNSRPTGRDEASDCAGTLDAQSLRDLAVRWEAQGQRLRLEGLARDVWQWDFPRPVQGEEDAATPAAPAQGSEASTSNAPAECSVPQHLHSNRCGTTTGSLAPRGDSSSSDGDGDFSSSSGSDEGCAGSGKAQAEESTSGRRIRISHADANRLLTNCYMRESYYDVVDVDSFGSETMHFPSAIDAVRYGGLLYLTCTDGFTSSGKRPARGLAAYGSYLRATPWANEQGLRMVIGAAVREAAARGVTLTPVFSLYSYHGPVFRVMLRATRSAEWHDHHYGFMGHCFVHGDNYTVGWRNLGAATCRCESRGRRPAGPRHGLESAGQATTTSSEGSACTRDVLASTGASAEGGGATSGGAGSCTTTSGQQRDVSAGSVSATRGSDGGRGGGEGGGGAAATPLVLSGPLWTGPLHDAEELRAMAAEAARRGWTGFGLDAAAAPHLRDRRKSSRNVRPLEELLEVLLEEADPRLPPGFFSIDDSVARRLARPPPRDALIQALRAEGFAAARCHLEARAFRTDACMADVLRVAEERLGIPRRR